MSLEEKAKTLGELEEMINRHRFAVQKGLPSYENDKKCLEELLDVEWVPRGVADELEARLSRIRQLIKEFPKWDTILDPDQDIVFIDSVLRWRECLRKEASE